VGNCGLSFRWPVFVKPVATDDEYHYQRKTFDCHIAIVALPIFRQFVAAQEILFIERPTVKEDVYDVA
jgi:hypothetical protein